MSMIHDQTVTLKMYKFEIKLLKCKAVGFLRFQIFQDLICPNIIVWKNICFNVKV